MSSCETSPTKTFLKNGQILFALKIKKKKSILNLSSAKVSVPTVIS